MVPTVLLENLTSNADFVLEATYVGVPDEKWGEIPMALVKKTSESNKKEEDILTFLQEEGVDKGKITKWMLPVYVAFVDDIPKTSVGKYDKIAVRKQIEEFKAKAKRCVRYKTNLPTFSLSGLIKLKAAISTYGGFFYDNVSLLDFLLV